MKGPSLLKAHLKSTRQSPAQFSRKHRYHPSQVSRWLSGERGPDITTGFRLERDTGGMVPVASWIKRSNCKAARVIDT